MAFNAEDYINVIVEQIAGNFSELDKAVKICPDLQKAKKEYRKLQERDEDDFFALKEASDKVAIYQQSIGDLVCTEYRTVEPLSVGLFGEWGSGKTHLLKLIESRINQLQSNPTKKDPNIFPQTTIPIFFNAWRFEKEEHMIIPLFQTMLAQMQEYEHIPLHDEVRGFVKKGLFKLKVLMKSLHKGFKAPDDLIESAFKVVDQDISLLKDITDSQKVMDSYSEKIKEQFEHEALLKELIENDRLESIYYQIPEWIEKIAIFDNISFVFLIDDLDRCLPENTLKMLESIKLFLDVPSCAFVLAIDDDVVERGVEHHYRDYLKDMVRHELPITGHEYLEKMVQLPFRIPVIGTENVLEFLTINYKDRFEMLLEENREEHKPEHVEGREFDQEKTQPSKTDEILKFFAKTIPPKPRKIKRTAMLFETKIELLKRLKLERRDKLVAKITLLELFTPKLLRFMQNHGYESIYNRLVHFKSLKYQNDDASISLADIEGIKRHIDDAEVGYSTKERLRYHKLMDIIAQNSSSRMVFELDAIFDKRESEEDLKLNIEMTQSKKESKVADKITHFTELSMEKLFRDNDPASWADAFKDNKLLADGSALLLNDELQAIIDEAKKREAFRKDPEWMGIVARYISNDQYKHLLKELYAYRFSELIDRRFQMGIYQVTFAEYDRYAEIKGLEKIDDNEWGRGRRPVMRVNWHEATAYAQWLSEVLDVEYKLPSSEDWYLACNNGRDTTWHFGNDEKDLKDYAWYDANSDGQTHPVGEKNPNELGLYDMHGNVWEWCEDWYDEKEDTKVLRGGSWGNDANGTASSDGGRYVPGGRDYYFGFRLQRTSF